MSDVMRGATPAMTLRGIERRFKSGDKDLIAIAAFKSDVWPPASPPHLCGVFTYSMPR